MTRPQEQYQSPNLANAYQYARQNPQAFEEQFKKSNPQAYQRALQIKNSFANPQEAILRLAQERGINPNIINMLNL